MLEAWMGEIQVGVVEVAEIPEDYLKMSETEKHNTNYRQSFRSIIRGMIHEKVPVGLRLERINGKTRVLLLTWTRKTDGLSKNLIALTTTASAFLPKFILSKPEKYMKLDASLETHGVTACLLGEPTTPDETVQQSVQVDPMDAVGEVLQSLENVILQISIEPTKSSKRNVRGLEREYENAMERSQRMVSSPGFLSPDSQQSTTRVSASASRSAERLSRQIKRMSSQYLGKVTVTVTHWSRDKKYAETKARQVMSILMSGVTPADKEEDLRVVIKKKRKDFEKVLAGIPVGDQTILTPEETVTYFALPRVDMGIKVSRREDFSVANVDLSEMEKVEEPEPQPVPSSTPKRILEPKRRSTSHKSGSIWKHSEERLILFGYAIRNGEPQKVQPYGMVRKMLGSHIGVYGNTGYGKTTTCVSLAAQAYRNGVIPTILTPGNVSDWRVLKDLYSEFRIFTAGNPEIAPLHYNMWDVPPRVPVGKYIDRMVDVHTAALPTDGVISMHFDDIFNTMYENCGWSRMGNIRGRPILLSDLYEAVQQVANTHLEYGEELKRDFYGALDARLRSMLRNEILVDMFNTTRGLSIPELLAHPTIIEMRDLSPEDRALLIGALTVGISEYLVANPRKEVSHFLVLEEAHQFLKGTQSHGAYAEPTSTQKAVSNIVEMLRTQRGAGLGLCIIDQLPSSLPPEVVKLPSNVIIHTLTDLEERVLVGRQALCSDAQINHIGGMGVGEVVARIQTQNVPTNVQIAPLNYLLHAPLPEREWTDEMVRDAMRKVFESSPELAESQPLTKEMKDLLRGIRPRAPAIAKPEIRIVQVARDPETDISVIVNTPSYVDAYMDRVGDAAKGDPSRIARLLTKVASKFATSEADQVPFAERLLLHSAGMLKEPKETAVLADILIAIRGVEA
ncbi:MAG: ATP-binding protein [Candidatus Thorarchaeota archaeon]